MCIFLGFLDVFLIMLIFSLIGSGDLCISYLFQDMNQRYTLIQRYTIIVR